MAIIAEYYKYIIHVRLKTEFELKTAVTFCREMVIHFMKTMFKIIDLTTAANSPDVQLISNPFHMISLAVPIINALAKDDISVFVNIRLYNLFILPNCQSPTSLSMTFSPFCASSGLISEDVTTSDAYKHDEPFIHDILIIDGMRLEICTKDLISCIVTVVTEKIEILKVMVYCLPEDVTNKIRNQIHRRNLKRLKSKNIMKGITYEHFKEKLSQLAPILKHKMDFSEDKFAILYINSERSDECIDFTMICFFFITSRNNAPISNFGGGFRCKSEYPWCIIQIKS
ncbi:Uncharacterized protein FWK35_00003639 [Aphis craccivora]|uniref:Uncharacterized protein n=1 Tax=Aphis craccivora TaxID=307492 RepID=A0A6G0ZMB3_APHCR|nr:Uncharacterized protein FWK35_00003639 [Aphis craccivora]